MKRLEEYISKGDKLLRCGYTTGTCAAAATSAATELLLASTYIPSVVVSTPSGIDVEVEVEHAERGEGWAQCAVMKDGGDDPDVTDGVLVYAEVTATETPGIVVDGGLGVGRVTKEGLDQPVGAAAINSVPRAMIAQAAYDAATAHAYEGGLLVTISIPAGVELAAKTFNPRLGIKDGISVLGTTGIVRPMSEEALVSSIKLELSVLRASGVFDVLVVPGNYGRDFACNQLGLGERNLVSCANYIGAVLDEASRLGFDSLLLVGHIGKLVKVAGGIMNTHSRVADGRMEVLATHAAIAGASAADIQAILNMPTTDAVLDLLDERGLLSAVMASIMERMAMHLAHRAPNMQVEAIMFSNRRGILGMTNRARQLMMRHANSGGDDAWFILLARGLALRT